MTGILPLLFLMCAFVIFIFVCGLLALVTMKWLEDKDLV